VRRRALLALVVPLLVPATAAAHGGTGMPAATDTKVVVVAITPAVPGLRAVVIGNDFDLRLYLPDGAEVVVNRTGGARPLRQTGGTLTWREHRLRHPLPDGTLQIGFTLAGRPVVLDLESRRGTAPSPWPPIVLVAAALVAGLLRPRWAPGLAVGAFVAMLIGAAGGLVEGRGALSAVVLCVAVIVLSAVPVLAIAAVPERFRSLTAGAFAATALLLTMAQVPMLYRAYPVSAMPDAVARGLEAVSLALAIGALAAVIAGRPWRAFEEDDPGLPPLG
jgi:hypothetical protein